jgi:hypothetical protein
MDEDILAFGTEDEAETLLGIEPLDGADWHNRPPGKISPARIPPK